jgi:hypothetical protein
MKRLLVDYAGDRRIESATATSFDGDETEGAAGTIAGAGPSGTIGETAGGSRATAKSPGNSGPQGPGGSSTGGGSLPPCSSGPPYTSLPCR